MKKIYKLSFLILMLYFSLLVVGCKAKVKEISINEEIVKIAVEDKIVTFDELKLTVTYENGQVEVIDIVDEMVVKENLEELKQLGVYTITIEYGGKMVDVAFEIAEVYECSFWEQRRYQTNESIVSNILKNDDGSDVFDYYKLLFYKDGTFELVFKIKDSEEEVYSGNYTDKDGVRSLYYENKPDEFQDLYGASKYSLSEDGTVLTRKQLQFGPGDLTQIISQTFEIKK